MKIIGNYLRVSAASPNVHIAGVAYNLREISSLYGKAKSDLVDLIAFPELSLTGYTTADLFFQDNILEQCLTATLELAKLTKNGPVMIIGAPMVYFGKLFNCALVLAGGKVVGVVPKSYLPNYNEFYEKRWFVSGKDITNQTLSIGNQTVPFGVDLTFNLDNVIFGIEICEDLWAPIPPSAKLALSGAEVIVNLSASNELIGKSRYRRELVTHQSAKLIAGYIYAASSMDESTADTVFSGHLLIAANGTLLKEGRWHKNCFIVADIDIDHLRHDRRQNTTFEPQMNFRMIDTKTQKKVKSDIQLGLNPLPFVPTSKTAKNEVAEEILTIQAHGIATQMQAAGIKKIILGVSGGLDSTLALLAAKYALSLQGLPIQNLLTRSLPAKASSQRTRRNVEKLAAGLGTAHKIIPIQPLVDLELKSIKHSGAQDTAYENAQARVRTMTLMNEANMQGALILGTGDLSEIALGWATYNGDHMSTYHVNASVPKTLVRFVVAWAKEQPEFASIKQALEDILDTPVSPELNTKKGLQKTESLIGPYELHDFFLYHFKRFGSTRNKIQFLAEITFQNKYSRTEIAHWLEVFYMRFTANQFKRETSPNGPKIGSVSLSPRSDWRMSPSVSRHWADKA